MFHLVKNHHRYFKRKSSSGIFWTHKNTVVKCLSICMSVCLSVSLSLSLSLSLSERPVSSAWMCVFYSFIYKLDRKHIYLRFFSCIIWDGKVIYERRYIKQRRWKRNHKQKKKNHGYKLAEFSRCALHSEFHRTLNTVRAT